jgi:anti-sigma regulatory factor (Ser/Thr protein kinase)
MRCCSDRADAAELAGAAWTIFAELIDNIFSHSKTPLDGYAALQFYPNGNSLQVAVSDSGLGIMDTLRPVLKRESPALDRLSDNDIVEVLSFRANENRFSRIT